MATEGFKVTVTGQIDYVLLPCCQVEVPSAYEIVRGTSF